MANVAPSDLGSIGFASQSTLTVPGTEGYTSPTDFLLLTEKDLTEDYEVISAEVQSGTLDSAMVYQHGLNDPKGPIKSRLMANQAALWYQKLLGLDTLTPSTAISDTWSANTTANGKTTLTMVTGGAYVPGMWINVGTGATAEQRQIWSYVSGSKTLTMGALIKNGLAGTGSSVVPAKQHQFTPVNTSALRLLSIQDSRADQFFWARRDMVLTKLGLAGTKDWVDATWDFMAEQPPTYVAAGGNDPAGNAQTAPTFSAGAASDQLQAFTIRDGGLCLPADPYGTGTSALAAVPGIRDWSIDVDLGIIQRPDWSWQDSLKHSYGGRMLTLKATYELSGGRPDVWLDYIKQHNKVTAPAFAGWSIPTGGTNFKAAGLYFPGLEYTIATSEDKPKEVLIAKVEGHPIRDLTLANGNPVEIWVVNSQTSAAYS